MSNIAPNDSSPGTQAEKDEAKARADKTKADFRDAKQDLKADAQNVKDDLKANAQNMRDDLESQVSRLREDVAGVAESLRSLAGHRAEGARQQAYALRDDVRDRGERYIRQAQETASEFEEQLSERVRAEPIKSILIAAAVGYVYARLFR